MRLFGMLGMVLACACGGGTTEVAQKPTLPRAPEASAGMPEVTIITGTALPNVRLVNEEVKVSGSKVIRTEIPQITNATQPDEMALNARLEQVVSTKRLAVRKVFEKAPEGKGILLHNSYCRYTLLSPVMASIRCDHVQDLAGASANSTSESLNMLRQNKVLIDVKLADLFGDQLSGLQTQVNQALTAKGAKTLSDVSLAPFNISPVGLVFHAGPSDVLLASSDIQGILTERGRQVLAAAGTQPQTQTLGLRTDGQLIQTVQVTSAQGQAQLVLTLAGDVIPYTVLRSDDGRYLVLTLSGVRQNTEHSPVDVTGGQGLIEQVALRPTEDGSAVTLRVAVARGSRFRLESLGQPARVILTVQK